jgi:cupin fold WbuC family metalloprotein
MIKIDNTFIETISQSAKSSPRLRMNFNYHPQLDDLLQRMINAMEPGTYIQPHKHQYPDKTEVFFCLRGRIAVVEFNDMGEIKDYIVLDTKSGNYACEIPPRTWHTVISLETGSVAYEFKNGPYNPIDDKNFANWAPKEGNAACSDYLNSIIEKLGLA